MRRSPYLFCFLSVAIAFLLAVFVGEEAIPPQEIVRAFLSWVPYLDMTSAPETTERILFSIRLPRAVLLALTGAALGGSGAAYQGLLRNPLADPYLIGVAPGAGLGAVVAMVWHWPESVLGFAAVPAAAFLGALGTIAAVYRLARVGKTTPVTTLILAGVAVGSFAGALTSFLMLQGQHELRRVVYFMLGGFALSGWPPVWASLPYIALGLGVLIALARPLNVLQFGDEQAAQMGLNVERIKLVLVVAASLSAAAAVAFSGIIGFVGLAVPHFIRLLWGPDYRRLVPLSVLLGGTALLLADCIARGAVAFSTANAAAALHDLPVGVVTAFFGAPFFLFLLRRVRQSYW